MRTIIAGSRSVTDYEVLMSAMMATAEEGWEITQVISGGAAGADKLGEEFARICELPLRVFPADWKSHGKAAGVIRNIEMAQNADALVALWDGQSKGTAHMIRIAKERGLKVYVHRVDAA
jgi:hypothetical protein